MHLEGRKLRSTTGWRMVFLFTVSRFPPPIESGLQHTGVIDL